MFPQARRKRCWVHRTRNVINVLPKSTQPGAKNALQEIYNAQDRNHNEKAVKAFEKAHGSKWRKAVKKIIGDLANSLPSTTSPLIHLRTTNPIESIFSTVKLRAKVTRGAGSPAAALAMVFKLAEAAPDPLARGYRTPPRRTRLRRSHLRQRPTRRTLRRTGSSRLSDPGSRHAVHYEMILPWRMWFSSIWTAPWSIIGAQSWKRSARSSGPRRTRRFHRRSW
ncbi:transposase [Streptomyces sp. NPDC047009]|uniref:transposase n=1 Tax=Streptomyces sp. NPDC047009 TaxID=3154496 RepID=UPI00340CEAEB